MSDLPPIVAEFWLELPGDRMHWLKGRCAIGREQDNELILEARALSRHHALLTPGAEGYEIRDLGSSNGTHVNRERIQRAVVLRDGDEIQMGELVVRYRCTRPINQPQQPGAQKTTQMLTQVRTRACWLLLADIEGFAAHREKVGVETATKQLQAWIEAVRPLIEKNGGTIHGYLGDAIFAHWPCDLAAPEQVVVALQAFEAMRARSTLAYRLVVHHGQVLFTKAAQGDELTGRDVNFVLHAPKVAKQFCAPALLSEAAVRTLQLEGRCGALGCSAVGTISGFFNFFGLPKDLAAHKLPGQARRILLIEESSIVSDGFVRLLEAEHDLLVCGRVEYGASARRAHAQHKPDLVIIDLSIRTSETLTLIAELLTADAQTRVLVFTTLRDLDYVVRALRAGALGYVLKNDPTPQVLDAIRVVAEGGTFLSRQIAGAALRHLGGGSGGTPRSGPSVLSDRELEVFRLVGLGQPNREIAVTMGISVKTVEAHRENIKVKLNLGSAAEVAAAAKQWAAGAAASGAG